MFSMFYSKCHNLLVVLLLTVFCGTVCSLSIYTPSHHRVITVRTTPETWKSSPFGKDFMVSNEKYNFLAGVRFCQSKNSSNLIQFSNMTATERRRQESWVVSNLVQKPYWIGARNVPHLATYKWKNGQSVNKTKPSNPWFRGDPNCHSFCCALWYDTSDNTWNDEVCEGETSVVCERQSQVDRPSTTEDPSRKLFDDIHHVNESLDDHSSRLEKLNNDVDQMVKMITVARVDVTNIIGANSSIRAEKLSTFVSRFDSNIQRLQTKVNNVVSDLSTLDMSFRREIDTVQTNLSTQLVNSDEELESQVNNVKDMLGLQKSAIVDLENNLNEKTDNFNQYNVIISGHLLTQQLSVKLLKIQYDELIQILTNVNDTRIRQLEELETALDSNGVNIKASADLITWLSIVGWFVLMATIIGLGYYHYRHIQPIKRSTAMEDKRRLVGNDVHLSSNILTNDN